MRIHTYAPGAGAAVTHPDVAGDTKLLELVVLEVEEAVYQVGDETELDVQLSVVELFGSGPGHVVRHRCRRIEVTVAYAGNETPVVAHPSTHLRTVRAEALRALSIGDQAGADLVLRLPGDLDDLTLAAPLGSYVLPSTCAVTFDLVHLHRPQG